MNSGTEQEQPGQCKREKYAGGGTPSPRLCDVCLEGPCQRMQVTQQTEEISLMQLPADREMCIKSIENVRQMELRTKFDRPGIWVYAFGDELRVAIVNDPEAKGFTFSMPVPCLYVCETPKVRMPFGYRHAKMPEDYGKEVSFFCDMELAWRRGILRGLRTKKNDSHSLIVETGKGDGVGAMTIDSVRVFVIENPETVA